MTTTLLPQVTHHPSKATAVHSAVKTLFGTTSAETELTVAGDCVHLKFPLATHMTKRCRCQMAFFKGPCFSAPQ